MANEYADKARLTYFWNKIKQLPSMALTYLKTSAAVPTPASGWTFNSLYQNEVRKSGNYCTLKYSISGGTLPSSAGWVTLMTLPDGFRPQTAIDYFSIDNNDAYHAGQTQILNDGTVRLYYNTTSGLHNNLRGSVTYICDDAMYVSGVKVDDALSSTSENPVQNKVIVEALNNLILVENQWVAFSGGNATVNGKSGYVLINAYSDERSTSEANTYAVDSIQRDTSGNYHLKNVYASLSATVSIKLIWLKEDVSK